MKKLILYTLLIIFLFLPIINAELTCNFGEVNCTGKCGDYIDSNKNGICDESEIIKENNYEKEEIINKSFNNKKYNFLIIGAITTLIYGLSYFLVKKDKISYILHKKIWNIFLLISFLICGILGVLLVLRIEYGFLGIKQINQLFWHVEAGIVMTIISIFHLLWHFNYFKSYFKKKVIA